MLSAEQVDRVRTIVADMVGLPIDEVKLESNLYNDIGLDSLDVFWLGVALEDAFNIAIDGDPEYSWETVQDVVDFLSSVINEAE